MKIVNLARRPFENLRPVKRATLALWLLAVLLLTIDLWLYWGHLTGSSTTRDRLTEVRAAIARENAELDRLEKAFAALELDEQNAIVATLNDLIDKRTFPWGLLFDRLEDVLPDDAQLVSVRPQGQELDIRERRRSRAARESDRRRTRRAANVEDEGPEGIRVDLSGTAKTEIAIEDLIDNFWDDPAFDQPSLKNKRQSQTAGWDFNLDVIFLTAVVRAQASGDDPDDLADPDDPADPSDDPGDREAAVELREEGAGRGVTSAGRPRAGAVASRRADPADPAAADLADPADLADRASIDSAGRDPGAARGPARDWRRATRPGRAAATPPQVASRGAAGAVGGTGAATPPVAAAPTSGRAGSVPGAPGLPPAVLLPTAGQAGTPGTAPPTAAPPSPAGSPTPTRPTPQPTPTRPTPQPTPTSTPPPSPGPPPPPAGDPVDAGDDDRPVGSGGDASSTARLAAGGSGFAPGATP